MVASKLEEAVSHLPRGRPNRAQIFWLKASLGYQSADGRSEGAEPEVEPEFRARQLVPQPPVPDKERGR